MSAHGQFLLSSYDVGSGLSCPHDIPHSKKAVVTAPLYPEWFMSGARSVLPAQVVNSGISFVQFVVECEEF